MSNITRQSVALEPLDREIITRLVREKGLNFSSAIRFIVRDWHSLRSPSLNPPSTDRQPQPEQPHA